MTKTKTKTTKTAKAPKTAAEVLAASRGRALAPAAAKRVGVPTAGHEATADALKVRQQAAADAEATAAKARIAAAMKTEPAAKAARGPRLVKADGSAVAELDAATGLRLPPVVDTTPIKLPKPRLQAVAEAKAAKAAAAAAKPEHHPCTKCGRTNRHGADCRTAAACAKRAGGSAPAPAAAKPARGVHVPQDAVKAAARIAQTAPAPAAPSAAGAPAGGWTKGARRELAKSMKAAQPGARRSVSESAR